MTDEAAAAEAYDVAACALMTLARDGTIERANRTAASWTGWSAEELVGRRFQDLLTIGSKLFHHTHWLPLMEMQGSVTEVQLELATRDGRTVPVLVNGVRRSNRRIDVAIFVASDRRKYERELLLARRRAEELIEALRQREDEFRRIAENSPDVIARFDRERRCTYVSRAAETLSMRPAAEVVGLGVDELGMSRDVARSFAAAIDDALSGRDGSLAFEYERPDGSRVDLEARFVGERSSNGEITAVLALTRDVSALKQQGREAHQRAVLAEQLIGIVSHDLRNPLNAIMLGAHLLDSADVGPHTRVVERILSAAKRATRLTAELLDFTQARLGGGLRVTPAELDLHGLTTDTVEEIRLAWPGRRIDHRRVGTGTGAADADRIAQIITNLVNNAIAYGAPNQPITVSSIVGDDELEIRVHNYGRPIPEALQRDIFEPLRRGDEQVQRGSRSVGLGLYIVREIAVSHGGRVTAHSTADDGTTFQVCLPRAPTSRALTRHLPASATGQ